MENRLSKKEGQVQTLGCRVFGALNLVLMSASPKGFLIQRRSNELTPKALLRHHPDLGLFRQVQRNLVWKNLQLASCILDLKVKVLRGQNQ